MTDARLPAAYLSAGGTSFTAFLQAVRPDLLPRAEALPHAAGDLAPHGTTIVALASADALVMAGDRRATMGHFIASRDMEKVFVTAERSLAGIAGSAGVGIELIRLFRVELEHYEKLEGVVMSLQGQANRLAAMVRANLSLAMQGLAAVPIFGGYDDEREQVRLWSFDATGGSYAEREHHSIGSGSLAARGALKKLWRPGLTTAEALAVAIEALYDAADDDTATGGPDLARGVWPTVAIADADGARFIPSAEVGAVVAEVVTRREAPR
ncbi:proteasome subunit beta [Janibacter sp. GXQ6167]|uniref:proteasome subunit beta n=1 Tax=Janibacter sp. GXQ6167 TaxID=3240791 RepID=UPI003523A833